MRCCRLLLILVSVQLVTNAQSFSTPTSYPSVENPTFAAAADFDGDGKIDLATPNGLTNSVTFAFNNGTGSFPSRITYNSDPNPGWRAPEALAIGDFNADGKPDVAVGNVFGGPLSQGSVGILLNLGNRTFASPVAYNANIPLDVAVADVNADGKLDLVAASRDIDSASVLLGNGDGTFQTATTYPATNEPDGISVADFNGDAKPDLAVIHYAGNVLSILLGNGNGTFQAPVNYPAGSIPRGILAKDLNGDNKQDLVVAVAGSHAVYVYIGNGDGTFPAAVSYPVGSEPIEPSIGDLNGDGKDDILAVNANGSSYSVLRGNADGTFQAAITKTARFGSYSSTLADFDNDNKLDLAIINNVHDLVDVYLNSPTAQGSAFNATADTAATNVLVATFKDYDATKTAANFSATINWGDSTPSSSGTISANGSGGFNVNGTHTYTTAGVYNVAIEVSDTSGNFADATATANVGANAPSVTSAITDEDTQSTSGLVISRHANDGAEVTHFKITNILNGALFKSDGFTPIANGSFITFAEGNAGLRFTPAANLSSAATTFSFDVQAAMDSSGTGLSAPTAAGITVNAVAEVVSVTNATTTVNTQTTSGLVVTRNAVDGSEVTHLKITSITNGTLFKNDGVTQITNNSFITVAEGGAGLRFTPANNLASPSSNFSFQVQGATSSGGAGLGPAATATVTVKVPTTTIVSSSVNPSEFGQTVTFTAAVESNTGVPSGTVQFKDGLTNLGSPVNCAVLPPNACFAEFSTSTLSAGNHSISATYNGDTNFDSSTGSLAGGQVVNCVTNVVSNTNDSGSGSLRQAILGACPGGTITFAAGLTSGGPATITLTSGELLIDKNLTINGPGANLLSVSGNNSSRIFNVQAGTVSISALAIINGTVSPGQSGGGVLNRASLTLIACAITGNTAPVAGGGIQNSANNAPATLTIINSTISGNEGGSFGSGIFNGGTGGATVNLINSTVALNTNTSFGGGIYNSADTGTATLNVRNSTIAGNRAGSSGGGIFNFGNNGPGTVNVNNSIVADNFTPQPTEGPDIYNHSGSVSGNNNVIESVGGTANTGSNNSNVDPLLEKDGIGTVILKSNGGPTKTVLPAHNSPAVNNGSNAALPPDTFDLDGDANTVEPLPVDQRGPSFSRIVNATVDIGAVEANYTITPIAGSPQSAIINTAFASQLQALVQESGVNLSGFAVTFTAPASGATGSFASSATVNTNSSGIATAPVFTANGTAGGPYNVVASLSGESPAVNFSLTNLKVATTTSVSSSVNPSEFGQSVTFTATVTSNAGVPSGTVQFKDGGANLGAAQTLNASGVAQLTISSLTSGTHSISAEYLGNETWTGSTGTLQDGQIVKPQPTLSINDVSVTEGNSGTANLTFTVTLSAASNLTVSAGYSTANGTATTADNDYQSTAGTVTFTPGDLTETVSLSVNGDQKTEPDETVFVVLSNPVNAAFSDSQGQGTILNDDTLQLLLDTSGPDANQLAALDALLFARDPFRVLNQAPWFSSQQNTRVILFAVNLQLGSGDSPSVVKVTLLDGIGQTHEVSADDVRAVPNTTFTQVIFRLPDALAAGTYQVSIKAHERISNTGTFRIVP